MMKTLFYSYLIYWIQVVHLKLQKLHYHATLLLVVGVGLFNLHHIVIYDIIKLYSAHVLEFSYLNDQYNTNVNASQLPILLKSKM